MNPPNISVRPGDLVVMNGADARDEPTASEILAAQGSGDGRNFYQVLHPGDIVAIPQLYKDIPVEILERSEILEDHRIETVRTFLGIPISRHPYGYSFVVLKIN